MPVVQTTLVICREEFGGRLYGRWPLITRGGRSWRKNMGQSKPKLRTDCGLLFLGLENNRTIVVTFSFAR